MKALWSLVIAVVLVTSMACSDEPIVGTPAADLIEPASAEFTARNVKLELKEFVSGLSSPLGLTHAGDGTGRLYVVEQGGTIKVIESREVRATPFLDISDLTEGGGEQGLLGLAFHPRYEDNRRFFINYTDNAGDTVVAEYKRAKGNAYKAVPTSARVLLTIEQPFANHNGGALAFGPDGFLYIGMGDGGSAGDPMGNGQRTDTLLGKILRIDVNSSSPGTPYGIPNGNPYNGSNGRREIYSIGLRNPWRITFDRSTGDLWIGDVGQSALEEIDRAKKGTGAGANYGWNVMEGDRCYPAGANCAGLRQDFTDPIAVYSHDFGCSVTGGYVYRGRRYPVMKGGYFFGDYCSGNIWAIASGGGSPQSPELLIENSGASISSFGEDRRGELYLTDLGGTVYRLTATSR